MNGKILKQEGKQIVKIKRNICAVGTIIASLTLIVGCRTNGVTGVVESNYDEKYINSNETVNCEVSADDLTIKMSVKDSPEKVPEVKIMLKRCDEKLLVKELLNEGIRTEFYDDNCIQYSGQNGDILNILDNGFYMLSDFSNYIFNSFRLSSKDANNNSNRYSQMTDFEFMSRQEALDMVANKLKTCDVNLGEYEATVYALDYKSLKEEERVLDINGVAPKEYWKDSWTEDDNCYYITMRPLYNDIPEYHLKFGTENRYEDYNSPIQAIVSKAGIRYIEVDCNMVFENTGIYEEILDPQNVLDKVTENKYYVDGIWEEEEYTLTKMNLCYYSNIVGGNVLETIPIYQMYFEEKYWDGNQWGSRVNQLLIDARTGEKV